LLARICLSLNSIIWPWLILCLATANLFDWEWQICCLCFFTLVSVVWPDWPKYIASPAFAGDAIHSRYLQSQIVLHQS
jgi:hypothetical protein